MIRNPLRVSCSGVFLSVRAWFTSKYLIIAVIAYVKVLYGDIIFNRRYAILSPRAQRR